MCVRTVHTYNTGPKILFSVRVHFSKPCCLICPIKYFKIRNMNFFPNGCFCIVTTRFLLDTADSMIFSWNRIKKLLCMDRSQ